MICFSSNEQWYCSNLPTDIYTPFKLDSAKKINKKIVKAHSETGDRISKSTAIIKSSSQRGPYNLLHELKKRAQTTDSTINFFNILPNHFSTTLVRTSNQENLRMRKQQYLWARCQIPVVRQWGREMSAPRLIGDRSLSFTRLDS